MNIENARDMAAFAVEHARESVRAVGRPEVREATRYAAAAREAHDASQNAASPAEAVFYAARAAFYAELAAEVAAEIARLRLVKAKKQHANAVAALNRLRDEASERADAAHLRAVEAWRLASHAALTNSCKGL